MRMKNGDMAVQELGSSGYKNRDDEDMAKQGKKQQFEVRFYHRPLYLNRSKLMRAEKFWFPVNVGLHNNDDVHLGSSAFVSPSAPSSMIPRLRNSSVPIRPR